MFRCFIFVALGIWATLAHGAPLDYPHVVVIVWDGMRPDFVSDRNTPVLAALARRGVTFAHHHAVYLSSTEVNGTAISTGVYPSRSGIVGNNEYRFDLDPLKFVHTESVDTIRKGDKLTRGRYLDVATIAEIVRRSGRKTVVAGAKPVAILADRSARDSEISGVNLFAGNTFPPDLLNRLTNKYGVFPNEASTSPSRIDWTISALTESLWQKEVPAFTFVWMNQPDLSQHLTGPGSPTSLAAMRNADQNLGRILQALEAKGLRDSCDILVVSDHGVSTIDKKLDLADILTKAGVLAVREFTKNPVPGDIIIVSNGGSTLLYVIGHESRVVRQVVEFLQKWEFSGVIFCREEVPGTFPLREARIDSPHAPDIVLSMRWNNATNENGVQGMITSDISSFGPGQGGHVSLSALDMHGTLIATGPHFKAGIIDTLASGNVDIAPTVLRILGLKPPRSMNGRILTEALAISGPPIHSFITRRINASANLNGVTWTQYLNLTEVNGVRYLDEGNGGQTHRADRK